MIDGRSSTVLQLDRDLLAAGQLIIPVLVNGKGPFPFVFDTGGRNLVETKLAEELGLARKPAGRFWGSSGGTDFAATTVGRFTLGALELRNQAAVVTSNDEFSTDIDLPFRGCVGVELLQRLVATIDYQAGTLTLTLPEHFDAPPDAIALPIEFPAYKEYSETMPLIPARIDEIEGGFFIDTGDNGGITLMESFIAAHGLSHHYEKSVLSHFFGYGGIADTLFSRARSFEIASTAILEPIINIPQGESGPVPPRLVRQDKGREIAGSVGNGLLRHFTLTFDYPHQRILLSPVREPFPARQAWNRAGFFLGCRAGRCKVLQVVPASPAAEAGIREGDIIVSLDGMAAAPMPDATFQRLLSGPDGTIVKVSVTGPDGVRDLSVVLRDLL